MKFPKFASLAPQGETFVEEAVNEGIWVTAGHLEGVENRLTESEAKDTTITSLNEQLSNQALQAQQATADLATANDTIAARDARIAELEAENEKLSKQPAADFQSTSKEKDETAGANKYFTSVDAEAARLRAMRSK